MTRPGPVDAYPTAWDNATGAQGADSLYVHREPGLYETGRAEGIDGSGFAIQVDLIKNPGRGDIVQGTRGARKARIADPGSGRGKRGSYRYMYLSLELKGRIHLLYLYGKNETEDLSPSQKKVISQLVDAIREQEKGN